MRIGRRGLQCLYLAGALICSVAITLATIKVAGTTTGSTDGPPTGYAESITSKIELVNSVYLLGDAGKMSRAASALLQAVAARQTTRIKFLFLGDNIYPAGLPPRSDKDFKRALGQLRLQTEAVKKARAEALFIPGNHDWGSFSITSYSTSNLQRILDQQQFVVEELHDPDAFAPHRGCPGPHRSSIGSGEIITLDTQWLLFSTQSKGVNLTDCPDTNQAVYAALHATLEQQKGWSIIATHHPLESIGRHSMDSGETCAQGLLCDPNREVRDAIKGVLSDFRPLLCVAGHDHSLQVLKGGATGCRYFVVSGAMSNTTSVREGEESYYARKALGFIRVDFPTVGRPRLKVYTVQGGADKPEFELELDNA